MVLMFHLEAAVMIIIVIHPNLNLIQTVVKVKVAVLTVRNHLVLAVIHQVTMETLVETMEEVHNTTVYQ